MPPTPPPAQPPVMPAPHSPPAFWYALGGFLALLVIIGAFYYLSNPGSYANQPATGTASSTAATSELAVSPSSGGTPLSVTFHYSSTTAALIYDQNYEGTSGALNVPIDFGDGSSGVMTAPFGEPTCDSGSPCSVEVEHIYRTAGTYTATIKDTSGTIIASATVTSSTLPSPQAQGYEAITTGGGPGNASCYFSRNGEVYWSSDLQTYAPVQGADLKTFNDFTIGGLCLGEDASHVYTEGGIFPGASPTSFRFLARWRGNAEVFFENGSGIIGFMLKPGTDVYSQVPVAIPNSDATTFEGFEGLSGFVSFGKDKNNVYCQGNPIPGADSTTAKQVESYAGDWLKVSVSGKPLVYNTACAIVDPSVPEVSGAS